MSAKHVYLYPTQDDCLYTENKVTSRQQDFIIYFIGQNVNILRKMDVEKVNTQQ